VIDVLDRLDASLSEEIPFEADDLEPWSETPMPLPLPVPPSRQGVRLG
jgi:hypothetical protein